MLGVRLDEQLETRLNLLAEHTQRSKSYLAKQALLRYIDEEERKQRENELTLSRWREYQETGEVVSNDAMMDWLSTWGEPGETQCPMQ